MYSTIRSTVHAVLSFCWNGFSAQPKPCGRNRERGSLILDKPETPWRGGSDTKVFEQYRCVRSSNLSFFSPGSLALEEMESWHRHCSKNEHMFVLEVFYE